jgi:hypothetical protein
MTKRSAFRPRAAACALLIACCIAPASSPAARESRADSIARGEEEKAARLAPEGPSGLERAFVYVEQSPVFGSASGAYPWFGSAYTGTGLSMGGGYVLRRADGANAGAVAGFSVRGSWLLEVRSAIPEIGPGLPGIELDASRATAKRLSFYGLTQSSRLENPLRYECRPAEIGASAHFKAGRRVTFSGGYRWTTFRTDAHGAGAEAGASDLDADLSFHAVGAEAAVDWRTSPGYSTRGGFHRLSWSLYHEAHGRPYSFQSLEYEALQLVPLLREQYVLVFRGLVTFTRTDGADRVPVVFAPTLGGGETLRGYETRRFTDRDRLLLTGEYRWRPSRFVDMEIFVDAGTVGGRGGDLGLSGLASDWGFGTRWHVPTALILRAELAKSPESWQFVFSVGKEVL